VELVLTDEQKLLQDSAAKLIERSAGPAQHRALRDTDCGFDRDVFMEIAEAGWLALLVGEDAGGLGLGTTELALVLEQAGRGLLTAPVTAASAAAWAIAEGGNETLGADVLPDIIAGTRIVLPAIQENPIAVDFDNVAAEAKPDGGGFSLNGRKAFIAGGAGADGFLVNARAPDGMALCYVPADADGLHITVDDAVDAGGLASLALGDVAVPAAHVVAGANLGAGIADRMHDILLIGVSADLLGVMERALDITLDYLRVREQFGRPIGSFQALQHMAVDDHIEIELTRSLLYQVCAAIDEDRGNRAMAAAVKARAAKAGLAVTKSTIQLHGAIGFTDEHDIGLYLRRAMALAPQYGNQSAQTARYAALAGALEA
jgi:alkylation response protein AidB-like acyl-CoA dehydrogenase